MSVRDKHLKTKRYGESRVIRIDSLDNIPKVTCSTYVKLFME